MGSQVRTLCFSWRDEFKGEADCRHIFIAVGLLYHVELIAVLSYSYLFTILLWCFKNFLLAKFFVVLLRATLSLSDE